jgi:hypothetical protein
MRSKRQLLATRRNRFALIQAVFGPRAGRTFANGCAPSVPYLFHRNGPKTAQFRAWTDNREGRSTPSVYGTARSASRAALPAPQEGTSANGDAHFVDYRDNDRLPASAAQRACSDPDRGDGVHLDVRRKRSLMQGARAAMIAASPRFHPRSSTTRLPGRWRSWRWMTTAP